MHDALQAEVARLMLVNDLEHLIQRCLQPFLSLLELADELLGISGLAADLHALVEPVLRKDVSVDLCGKLSAKRDLLLFNLLYVVIILIHVRFLRKVHESLLHRVNGAFAFLLVFDTPLL